MNPQLSVIIPVYNVEQYIDECLKSVIEQSLKYIEIIIVNDGSTDNSLKICKEYQTKDSRIRIVNKDNGGLSSARNIGIQTATGEFIGFVDSDDFIEKNMFEVLYKLCIENKADVAVCNCCMYDESKVNKVKKAWVDSFIEDKIYLTLDDRKKLLYPCLAWLKIYKRSFVETYKLSFIEGIIFEDNPWNMKVLSLANKIVGTREILYFYRDRPNSIMCSLKMNYKENKRVFDIFKVTITELDFIKKNFYKTTWGNICESYIIGLLLNHYRKIFKEYKIEYFNLMKQVFGQIKPTKELEKYCTKWQYIRYLTIIKYSFNIFRFQEILVNIITNPSLLYYNSKRYFIRLIHLLNPYYNQK